MKLDGIMSFPVTPFDSGGEIALDVFRRHVSDQLAAGPGALFIACGTGEFFSLDPAEYGQLAAAAVQVVGGSVPVFAGAGYGIRQARPYLQAAREAGISGLLVMPPYLVQAPQQGLIGYYETIAAESQLPVIVYQRDNVRLDPGTVVRLAGIPGIIGLKDGRGDIELMTRIRSALRQGGHEDFLLLNGTPTAEVLQPAYSAIDVPLYSSAVHCFVPEVAHGFYNALVAGDSALTGRYLDEFYRPFIELRSRGAGYAVALVKAGIRSTGLDVGGVRVPLADPTPEHCRELDRIIEQGRSIG